MSLAEDLNRELGDGAPVLEVAFSELGRQAAFPPDIPHQSAEARGKE